MSSDEEDIGMDFTYCIYVIDSRLTNLIIIFIVSEYVRIQT